MSTSQQPPRRGGLLDWKGILGLVISAVALWYTFSRMDLRTVASELRAADPFLFVLSSAAVTGVFWIRAWRWRGILAPVADVPFRSRFAAVTIGFMGNNLLPARVGEFMRAYALSRTEPVPIVASFASLLIERIFDGILVIALLFVAMAMPDFPAFSGSQEIELRGLDTTITISGLAQSLGAVILVVVLVLGLLVLFPRHAVSLLERVVSVLPAKVRRPIVDALEAFLSGAGVLRDPKLLLGTAGWSALLWTYNAVGAWIAFRAFGFTLPFTAAVFLQSAIALAVSVPAAPGFVGVYHSMVVFVLATLWGAPMEQAGAFAIGFHVAGFIPVTLIGLYYAWRTGLSLGEVRESEDIVEEAVEDTLQDEDRPGSSDRTRHD